MNTAGLNISQSATSSVSDAPREVNHHHPRRVPAIDGLRAFAVIAVILYHLNHSFLPGGFVGVDVFFVISGYVVTASLLKDRALGLAPFIGAFYVRRILRIYPALIAMLIATGVLSMLFIPESNLSLYNVRAGKWAFFGLSNFALLKFTNSYFAINNDYNPYEHTWSLGVEEQYYFLFPIVLFLFLRRGQSRPAKWFSAALLPTLGVASLAFSILQTKTNHAAAYFLLFSRFWELAVGALLRVAHERGSLLPGRSASPLVAMSGVVLLIASVVFVNPMYFPFPLAIPPVAGSALLISAMVAPFAPSIAIKPFLLPASVFIGRISYSVYLWHWVIIALFRWTVGIQSALPMLIAVALALLLGTASFYWLEQPIQRWQKVCQNYRVATLLAGIAIILACQKAYSAVSAPKVQRRLALSTVERHFDDWNPDLGDNSTTPKSSHWSGHQLFCIGDSHASAYNGMLRLLHENDGVKIIEDSTPFQNFGSFVVPTTGAGLDRQPEILSEIKSVCHPGDVVLLANLRVARFCEQWGLSNTTPSWTQMVQTNQPLAFDQAAANVRQLLQMDLNVVIDAPLPVLKAPPFRGADWFNRMNPIVRDGFEISRKELLDHREFPMQILLKAQKEFPALDIWDPMDVLCPQPVFNAFDGSTPLYFDGDHLTALGGQRLYPSFKKELSRFWKD